jgi:hypothetical protein
MPISTTKSDLPNLTCDACGKPLSVVPDGPGRIPRFCDTKCRVAFHRGRRPPAENLPTLDDLLTVLRDLADGSVAYARELRHIETILKAHYARRD